MTNPPTLRPRPITFQEFVERLDPSCAGADDEQTGTLWVRKAHPRIVRAAQELGYTAEAIRRGTLEMLRASAMRLSCARTAAEALSGDVDPGILSLIVAGSAARGEAVAASDVDFDAFVTEPFMQSLHSRRDRKAATPHELLRNYEQKLRRSLETGLKEQLGAAGFDTGSGRLTMKPFSQEQLVDTQDSRLALLHLLNLLYGATPVSGTDAFYSLLEGLLASPSARQDALLGRIVLLRCRDAAINGEPWVFETPTRKVRGPEPLSAAHTVAACISATIASALDNDDPQLPYWRTFDEAAAIIEPEVRGGLELFVAWVTLARSGAIDVKIDIMRESLETALGALPIALDAIIDHLAAHGAPDEAIEGWELVQDYLANPTLARNLADELGLR